jgi:hypothetical protein
MRSEFLNFIKEQYPKGLVSRYNVQTGEPSQVWPADPVEYALLIRLALIENNLDFAKMIIQNEIKPIIETEGSSLYRRTDWFAHAVNILFALREYQEKIAK